jgi:pimeloyl-ACP methyl ester carboxylesterase
MATFDLPTPQSVFDIMLEDGTVTRVRQHGDPDRPVRLFLSHGNGFASDGYLPFWQPLLTSFEVILFDHRNHGWNAPSNPARHHYAQLAHDTETLYHGVTARLGAKPSVGVFHSMAAKAAMKHAVEIGWRWQALVLFDPPNVPPLEHPLYSEMAAHGQRLADWAEQRQECFEEPGQLAAEFKRLRVHRNWVPGAHELMARALLRHDANTGAWRLVCPGALEAQMYRSNMALHLWPPASAFGGPVLLICADPTGPRPGGPALVNKLLADTQGYRYEVIPGADHMLQLEQPEACRQVMIRFLAEYGLALFDEGRSVARYGLTLRSCHRQ